MTVEEVIKELQKLPPKWTAVMAKDGEGNSFSPVAQVAATMYIPDSTWYGECPHPNDVEDYEENAVVLWPTN